MNIRILVAAILLAAINCHAQSVSPVITEENVKAGKTYSGEVAFTSTSLKPLSVMVEAVSFTVLKDGSTSFRKLDPGIHVELLESSALVGVNQQHLFDFRVSCDKYPCAFTIYSSAVIGHTSSGEAVRLRLPSTYYLCAKGTKSCRDFVRAQMLLEVPKPKDPTPVVAKVQ